MPSCAAECTFSGNLDVFFVVLSRTQWSFLYSLATYGISRRHRFRRSSKDSHHGSTSKIPGTANILSAVIQIRKAVLARSESSCSSFAHIVDDMFADKRKDKKAARNEQGVFNLIFCSY